jgi:FKBP-type peptidyl-prolyl cis-trans isomerase (trigger factor)
MHNNVELKSKALNVFNYKDVDISSLAVHYEPDMEKIEKELLRLQKKYAQILEAEEVLSDDVVVLSCKSENKRFNKESISIIVGKGLFSKELEKNLLGMKKAEEKELVINGDKVWVYINKISRTVIPELTDEVVIKWDFEGLKSVNELRKWVKDKQHVEFLEDEEYIDLAVACITKKVAEKSTFALDEGECSKVEQEMMKRLSKMLEEQGVSLETVTKEQAKEILGSSIDDYIAMAKGLYEDGLKVAVIGNKLMKEEQPLPTIEDYEKEVKGYAEFQGHDIEEEKQIYTLEDYMKQQYSAYYIDILSKYALEYFKEREI